MDDHEQEDTEERHELLGHTLGEVAQQLAEAESSPTPLEEDGQTVDKTKLAFIKGSFRSAALTLHEHLELHFSQHAGEAPATDYHTALNNFILAAKEEGWQPQGSAEGKDLYLHLCSHDAVATKRKEGIWPVPFSVEDCKTFVRDCVQNLIFTSNMIDRARDIELVFMPISLGVFHDRSEGELKNIGLLYEYISTALPRGVNGMPMFLGVRIMNREDALKCMAAVRKQLKVLEEIEV